LNEEESSIYKKALYDLKKSYLWCLKIS
jgi:hypothetical protein